MLVKTKGDMHVTMRITENMYLLERILTMYQGLADTINSSLHQIKWINQSNRFKFVFNFQFRLHVLWILIGWPKSLTLNIINETKFFLTKFDIFI